MIVASFFQFVCEFEDHCIEVLGFEFVRRYRLASPLLLAAIVEGGWYEVACI